MKLVSKRANRISWEAHRSSHMPLSTACELGHRLTRLKRLSFYPCERDERRDWEVLVERMNQTTLPLFPSVTELTISNEDLDGVKGQAVLCLIQRLAPQLLKLRLPLRVELSLIFGKLEELTLQVEKARISLQSLHLLAPRLRRLDVLPNLRALKEAPRTFRFKKSKLFAFHYLEHVNMNLVEVPEACVGEKYLEYVTSYAKNYPRLQSVTLSWSHVGFGEDFNGLNVMKQFIEKVSVPSFRSLLLNAKLSDGDDLPISMLSKAIMTKADDIVAWILSEEQLDRESLVISGAHNPINEAYLRGDKKLLDMCFDRVKPSDIIAVARRSRMGVDGEKVDKSIVTKALLAGDLATMARLIELGWVRGADCAYGFMRSAYRRIEIDNDQTGDRKRFTGPGFEITSSSPIQNISLLLFTDGILSSPELLVKDLGQAEFPEIIGALSQDPFLLPELVSDGVLNFAETLVCPERHFRVLAELGNEDFSEWFFDKLEEFLQFFARCGFDFSIVHPRTGMTPLMAWARKANSELIEAAIERGDVNLHATDYCGRTALHHAVEMLDLDVVVNEAMSKQRSVSLLCRFSNSTIRNHLGKTALELIFSRKSSPVDCWKDSVFVNVVPAQPILDYAFSIQNEDLHRQVIKDLVPLWHLHVFKDTVNLCWLILAIQLGETQAVQEWIKGSANTIVDSVGMSATHAACRVLGRHGSGQSLNLALTYYGNVALPDKQGKTGLQHFLEGVIERSYVERTVPLLDLRQVNKILLCGGDVDWAACGSTPLHLCVMIRSDEASKYLIKVLHNEGASLHVRDRQGRTPVEYARQEQREALVSLFLNLSQQDRL